MIGEQVYFNILMTKCLIAVAQGTLTAGMALFSISQNVIFTNILNKKKCGRCLATSH
jgi:hypothetical protein